MPEFKVASGTLDAVIQFFEQTLHITFPTHASGGGGAGGGGGGAAVQQSAPVAPQDMVQQPAPVPPQDIHHANFTVFPADAGQAALDAINEQLRQAGADGNAFGSFGPNIAPALIEAINDPHRPHDAFSDWFNAVGAPWTDIG